MTLYLQGEGDRGFDMTNFVSELPDFIPERVLRDLLLEMRDLDYSDLMIQLIFYGFDKAGKGWYFTNPSLFGLDFGINDEFKLPEGLFNIEGLERIIISPKGSKFPIFFIHEITISTLKELVINNTFIERIPVGVFQLPNLRKGDFSHNSIKEVPVEIIPSTNQLRELYLNNNNLGRLMPYLFLPRLEILDISNNDISNIRHLWIYKKMVELRAANNDIVGLHEKMFPPSLMVLNLRDNYIVVLPEKLELNDTLRVLDLSKNMISYFPEAFFNIVNLRELYLSENDIFKFPFKMAFMKSLSILDLSYNNIRKLPDMTSLISLKKLNLDCNSFEEKPENK